MKKYMFLAAAVLAMAACSKQNPATESGTDTTSTEGRKVTLCVNAPEGSTKVAGTDNGNSFSFKWEEGDKVKVTVSGRTYPEPEFMPGYYEDVTETAEFTLATGAGTSSATFTGTIPEVENIIKYTIQYPYESAGLSTQAYEVGKVPVAYMSFTSGELSTLDNPITLSASRAILQLNLFGIARSVSKIEVIDTGNSKVLNTLNCSPAVTVGKNKDNATPFYIVMNETNAKLQIDVTMNEVDPEEGDLKDYEGYGTGYAVSSKTFTQSSAKTISAGTCVNMPAICITTIWAPVNCGYDPDNYKYGLLYQWGRKDGCRYEYTDKTSDRPQEIPYNDAGDKLQISPAFTEITTTPLPDSYAIIRIGDEYKYFTTSVTSPIAAGEENAGYFYNTTDEKDWLSPKDDSRWDATGGSTSIHFPTKGDYDPCPEGWRLPTNAEMQALLGSHTSGGLQTGTHGTATDVNGKWFNGTSEATPTTGVFLPAAGYRVSNASGSAFMRGRAGDYWTSSVSGDRACKLGFTNEDASIANNDARSPGYSVRCVQE